MNTLSDLMTFQNPDSDRIPDIALYMDQLIDYLTEMLGPVKRTEDDPIFTKTMINNYVKARVIAPPEKKKYNKSTIMELIMLYHFKQVFSIADAHALLTSMKVDGDAYRRFCKQYDTVNETLPTELVEKLTVDDAKHLMLVFSIESVIKKKLSEQLLDFIQQEETKTVDNS